MDLRYKITQHIATISKSGKTSLELNVVSWNDREPKLDLRRWKRSDESITALKGLTMTPEEAECLKAVL